MADISTIHINNTDYNIKDATARSAIAALGTVIKFKGTKTTASAITSLTSADAGDLWIVVGSGTDNGEEYLCKETFSGGADTSKWEMLGTVAQTLGAFAYVDTGTVTVTHPFYTLGNKTTGGKGVTNVGSLPSHAADTFSAGTLPSFTRGTFSAGTLPSFTEGEFDAGTLPSFTRGTFTQGTLPSFTQGTFSAGSLPSWSASVTNEVLSFSFSAGSLPSHAADVWSAGALPTHAADSFSAGTLPSKEEDTFDAGTLPSHAADSWSAGTLPSFTQGTFSAGSLPTLATNNALTDVSLIAGTVTADYTVYPASE